MQYLSTSRTPRHGERDVPDGQRAEPVRGPARRAARSTARPCSGSSCCGRIPEFGTFGIEQYTGIGPLPGGHDPGREALPQRQLVHGAVHALVAARQAELPEPAGRRARGSRLAERSSEPPLGRHEPARCRSARARSGAASWNGVVDAILGGWQVSGTYQYQSGFPLTFGTTSTTTRRAAIRASLTSNIGETVSGGIAGLDVPGVGHVVLLLPRRGRPDQRRGRSGQAARRPAHPARQQRALLPVDAAGRPHARPAPDGPRPLQELLADRAT